MSDTITQEERALWASVATSRINAVTPERQCEITAQERLVKALKALEQAEDRADFANNVLQAASDCVLSGDPTSDVGLFLDCDEFDKKLLVDIAALRTRAERAEASAEKAEKELVGADAEISELRDELEDSRGTEKDAPHVLCEIARLVGVYEHSQELGDDIGEMTLDAVRDLLADKQTAEANVARLTKGLDWLAGKLIDCPPKFTNCAFDCAECRKEAASRAVADSEVE